jgi:hypothetical protein
MTLGYIAKEKGCSISTIQRLFKRYLDNPSIPQIKTNDNCHLLIDGTYSSDWCQLNYFDNDLKYLQYFDMVKRETYLDYRMGLEALKKAGLKIVVLPAMVIKAC